MADLNYIYDRRHVETLAFGPCRVEDPGWWGEFARNSTFLEVIEIFIQPTYDQDRLHFFHSTFLHISARSNLYIITKHISSISRTNTET